MLKYDQCNSRNVCPLAQMAKHLPATQETPFRSLRWEDPLEQGTATHCSILVWRIPWRLAGYSPWGCKELDTTERLNDNCRAFLGRLGYLPALRGHRSPTALGNTQPSLFSGVREPSGKAGERQRQ